MRTKTTSKEMCIHDYPFKRNKRNYMVLLPIHKRRENHGVLPTRIKLNSKLYYLVRENRITSTHTRLNVEYIGNLS
jgi:hypothetical protein